MPSPGVQSLAQKRTLSCRYARSCIKDIWVLLPELVADKVDVKHCGKPFHTLDLFSSSVGCYYLGLLSHDHGALAKSLWKVGIIDSKVCEQEFILEVCECAVQHCLSFCRAFTPLLPQRPVACVVLIVYVRIYLQSFNRQSQIHMPCLQTDYLWYAPHLPPCEVISQDSVIWIAHSPGIKHWCTLECYFGQVLAPQSDIAGGKQRHNNADKLKAAPLVQRCLLPKHEAVFVRLSVSYRYIS